MFISVECRVRNFRGIPGSWKIVHYHRVGGVTTAAVWVELGTAFGDPSMEAILSYGVPRTLYTIWYTTYKLKTVESSVSQKISVEVRKRDKESMSAGGFIYKQVPIVINRRTVRVHQIKDYK